VGPVIVVVTAELSPPHLLGYEAYFRLNRRIAVAGTNDPWYMPGDPLARALITVHGVNQGGGANGVGRYYAAGRSRHCYAQEGTGGAVHPHPGLHARLVVDIRNPADSRQSLTQISRPVRVRRARMRNGDTDTSYYMRKLGCGPRRHGR